MNHISSLFSDLITYYRLVKRYFFKRGYRVFSKFEVAKDFVATNLYRQRGRFSGPFIHSGMVALVAFSIMIAPVIAQSANSGTADVTPQIYSPFNETQIETTVSEKTRDKVEIYPVQSGDTLASIAKKFDVSIDTLRWQNKLERLDQIKPGQKLEILPVTGIYHKVQKGDTVYSIAKKYGLESPQGIVDFPFNSFTNDETFALAIGQRIIIPDGVQPKIQPWSPLASVSQKTPNAGAVTASGRFVWPTGGTITQRFVWYHPAIDIANRAAPAILAADSGKVIVAGWPDNAGYGNRIVIDHGNGYETLYAHLSKIYVVAGQTVNRGDTIGQMGSTGRSTGTHLHFEIRTASGKLNPLNLLK